MKFSVVIPTHNRVADLRETLLSLASITNPGAWEVIVVDNNCTDETCATVDAIARSFPVDLRVVHESVQGVAAATNSGVAAASGDIIARADDDMRFDREWLVQAAQGLERFNCAYVGGKILPLWMAPVPPWVTIASARQRAVLGLVDYGPDAVDFGALPVVGGNMVMRRDAFDRVGPWDNAFGRKAGTLLGQEVREWCVRARNAGLRGVYVPGMVVYHIVPETRLTRAYFYRWFYWHGISRALLYDRLGLDMESPEREIFDFSTIPHIAGVPRYLYRTALRSMGTLLSAKIRGDRSTALDEQLWLCFFAGLVQQRWKDRRARAA